MSDSEDKKAEKTAKEASTQAAQTVDSGSPEEKKHSKTVKEPSTQAAQPVDSVRPEEKKHSNTVKQTTSIDDLLIPLINKFRTEEDDGSLIRGLKNLNSIAKFDSPPKPVKRTDFVEGVIGFRKYGNSDLKVTIACGKSMVRSISLKKFIAMIEHLDDEESATIMLENFTTSDSSSETKGQVLARINKDCSAISIIQGVTGRVIRGSKDIALFDNYYIDRSDLTAFYIAAKAQISNADILEEMITTYDGWKAFAVPLDPSNPHYI